MTTALSSMIVDSIVSLSTKVAVDGLVKIATPAGVKPVAVFALRAGTFLLGGVIAHKLSKIAVASTEELVEIVKNAPQEITSVPPTPDAV